MPNLTCSLRAHQKGIKTRAEGRRLSGAPHIGRRHTSLGDGITMFSEIDGIVLRVFTAVSEHARAVRIEPMTVWWVVVPAQTIIQHMGCVCPGSDLTMPNPLTLGLATLIQGIIAFSKAQRSADASGTWGLAQLGS